MCRGGDVLNTFRCFVGFESLLKSSVKKKRKAGGVGRDEYISSFSACSEGSYLEGT